MWIFECRNVTCCKFKQIFREPTTFWAVKRLSPATFCPVLCPNPPLPAFLHPAALIFPHHPCRRTRPKLTLSQPISVTRSIFSSPWLLFSPSHRPEALTKDFLIEFRDRPLNMPTPEFKDFPLNIFSPASLDASLTIVRLMARAMWRKWAQLQLGIQYEFQCQLTTYSLSPLSGHAAWNTWTPQLQFIYISHHFYSLSCVHPQNFRYSSPRQKLSAVLIGVEVEECSVRTAKRHSY